MKEDWNVPDFVGVIRKLLSWVSVCFLGVGLFCFRENIFLNLAFSKGKTRSQKRSEKQILQFSDNWYNVFSEMKVGLLWFKVVP